MHRFKAYSIESGWWLVSMHSIHKLKHTRSQWNLHCMQIVSGMIQPNLPHRKIIYFVSTTSQECQWNHVQGVLCSHLKGVGGTWMWSISTNLIGCHSLICWIDYSQNIPHFSRSHSHSHSVSRLVRVDNKVEINHFSARLYNSFNVHDFDFCCEKYAWIPAWYMHYIVWQVMIRLCVCVCACVLLCMSVCCQRLICFIQEKIE